jgi:hypothetical protein
MKISLVLAYLRHLRKVIFIRLMSSASRFEGTARDFTTYGVVMPSTVSYRKIKLKQADLGYTSKSNKNRE